MRDGTMRDCGGIGARSSCVSGGAGIDGTEARRVALEISDEYVASAMYDGIKRVLATSQPMTVPSAA